MKKTIVSLVVVSLILGTAGPVFASNDNGIPSVPGVPSIESVAPQSENFASSTINTSNLTALRARGKALINQRVRALNRLDQKIDKTKIAATDKAPLIADVNLNVVALRALGDKIASSTDAAIAKTDVQSIYTTYRVYAVFMPKINGIMTSFVLQQHADLMSTGTIAKYDAKIAEFKAAGKDVSEAETLMTDARAKIADALSKTQAARAGFATLLPANYPATDAVIKTNAQLLKDSRAALKAAEKSLIKVRTSLRGLDAKIKLEAQKKTLQEKLDAQKQKLQERFDAQKQKLEEKSQRGQNGKATGTKK